MKASKKGGYSNGYLQETKLMKKNSGNLKKRLEKGETVFGTWSSIPSASLVNIIGAAGMDFIVIDTEHGPISIETAENLVRAADVTGLEPIIRVSTNQPSLILQALDIGASGVQVPHIQSIKDAEIAIQSVKYYPKGKRGYSPFTRAGNYGLNLDQHCKKSNSDTMIILNLEGVNGLRNMKEIVKLDDIDVIFIGPYDLSQSLGKPGKTRSKDVINAIRDAVAVTKRYNIACGCFAHNDEYLKLLIDFGVRYITYMVDSSLMMHACREAVEVFNLHKS